MQGLKPDIWFPVVTLVIGALLKGLFDLLADKRTRQRERETRREQRSDAARQQRIEFQRTTLLELQETATSLGRMTARAHFEDVSAYRKTGHWKKNMLGEETSTGLLLAHQKFQHLRVRVRNKEIRELAARLAADCNATCHTSDEATADRAIAAAIAATEIFHEQIGAELRSLDDLEDQL